jgi:23S rRNA (uracil1939-C5)-methyltransferase
VSKNNPTDKNSIKTNPNIFCKHFDACGGCSLQNLSYENQLKYKKQQIENLFKPLWQHPVKITPSQKIKYYRNKMEFSFACQIDKTRTKPNSEKIFEQKLGQKEKNRWDRAFDLQECYLMSKESVKLVTAVRKWALENNIGFYDLRRHSGILRHLVVRESKNTTDKMVLLIAANDNFDKNKFTGTVKTSYPATSVLVATNKNLADTAGCDNIEILRGTNFITEKILLPKFELNGKKYEHREIEFKISPKSFFQTNSETAQKIYQKLRHLAAELKPSVIYDLYGGSGAFSMSCADFTDKCICIEQALHSIEDGKYNAKKNNISNIDFICAKTEDFLQSQNLAENSLVILDPPRAGLHPKALESLINAKPKNIIYVSCNPKTLFGNLQQLTQNYKIKSIESFDLFAHTKHLETVTHLSSV